MDTLSATDPMQRLHNEAKLSDREAYDPAFWQEGQAGLCNIVTYNGEDVRGVAYVADPVNRMAIIAQHNEAIRAEREREAKLRAYANEQEAKAVHEFKVYTASTAGHILGGIPDKNVEGKCDEG